VVALPAGEGLAAEPLFDDRFLLAGSAAQLRGISHPDPTGLNPDRLLLLEEGHCLAEQALEVCALKRSQTRVDLGASSLATLCGLVAEGFGLTFLPEIAVASESARNPGLRLARFAEPQPARKIALVRRARTPAEGWFSELAEVLREAGQELLARAETQDAPVEDRGVA